jgi:hypothetical protein
LDSSEHSGKERREFESEGRRRYFPASHRAEYLSPQQSFPPELIYQNQHYPAEQNIPYAHPHMNMMNQFPPPIQDYTPHHQQNQQLPPPLQQQYQPLPQAFVQQPFYPPPGPHQQIPQQAMHSGPPGYPQTLSPQHHVPSPAYPVQYGLIPPPAYPPQGFYHTLPLPMQQNPAVPPQVAMHPVIQGNPPTQYQHQPHERNVQPASHFRPQQHENQGPEHEYPRPNRNYQHSSVSHHDNSTNHPHHHRQFHHNNNNNNNNPRGQYRYSQQGHYSQQNERHFKGRTYNQYSAKTDDNDNSTTNFPENQDNTFK